MLRSIGCYAVAFLQYGFPALLRKLCARSQNARATKNGSSCLLRYAMLPRQTEQLSCRNRAASVYRRAYVNENRRTNLQRINTLFGNGGHAFLSKWLVVARLGNQQITKNVW